jgi:serine/threonine-protein kinase HipA
VDSEFHIFAYLGEDLPGALVAEPMEPEDVPVNEYTAMKLASLVGVDIPEIKLVEMDKLDSLPQINLPGEKLVFPIKRFDRNVSARIHMEDIAL